jgi:nucleotide-binding universal stress UspA family protein
MSMSPFKNALFAADFSEPSRAAFRIACSLATGPDAKVIALHVVEPGPGHGGPDAFGKAGALPPPAHGCDSPPDEEIHARLRRDYPPDPRVAVDYLVRHGTAAGEILREAADRGVELIALGTHGRTGLGRLLTGSVAEAVLRGARCPVLALRSPGHPGAEPGVAASIRTILHPTDFSECSAAAVPVARALVRDRGARLILLHAISLVDVPHLREPVCRESLAALREHVAGPDLECPVETRLRFGTPPEEILRAAGELECDLIVLGTHGRSGLGRLLLGSVAEEVLRRSPCPVLLVKPPLPAAAPMEPAVGSASTWGE